MNFKIYIQSENGFPIADWAVSAYMGFKEKGAKIILFSRIEEVPLSKNNVVVGFIQDIHKHIERLGGKPPKALNIPDELISFTGRNIRYMTKAEFMNDRVLPIFVKPNGLAKEYSDVLTPGVLTKESSRTMFFADVPDHCPLLVSEVVDFVSEYRGYVIEGVLKGIKHYQGDFRIFPDMKVIDKAISEYKTQPVGYAIDFGVTSDGRTLLIECNRGFALGNYGLEPSLYSLLLAKEWLHMMKQIPSK